MYPSVRACVRACVRVCVCVCVSLHLPLSVAKHYSLKYLLSSKYCLAITVMSFIPNIIVRYN